jgi:hypothetical protein
MTLVEGKCRLAEHKLGVIMITVENAQLFRVLERLGLAKPYLWLWRKEKARIVLNYRRVKRFKQIEETINQSVDAGVISRIARDLTLEGIAKAHISEFSNMPSPEDMKYAYEKLLIAEGASPHSRKGKSFIERLIDDDFSIKASEDPISTYLINPGVAMACAKYLGLIPKLTSFKVWRSHQIELQERSASQNWHRDYNEYQMVRVFYYFNDVTSDNGAGEYIKGSHFKGDSFDKLQDSEDGLSRYSTENDVRALFSDERIAVAEGITGTLYFLDTAGLHRGGFHPVPGERKVSLTTFSTAADLQPTRIRKPSRAIKISPLFKGVLV